MDTENPKEKISSIRSGFFSLPIKKYRKLPLIPNPRRDILTIIKAKW
ncbi:unnamed protein product [marine sediment metagenome]|uniref:Uncharacterized protein n=1 Tax=marine sediment metagenome TaxID=412755 RepID=X1VNF4_9ZZZZ